MSIEQRLARLESYLDGTNLSDRELYARCEPLARAHDVSLDELVGETRRFLAMTPAQQEQAKADLRAQLEAAGEEIPEALR